jgi:HTH-type transcriptional regulator / antitoxin HipB
MLDILTIGSEVAARRRSLRLSQSEVANRAGISRATLDALENGRAGEHGYSKITRLLSVLGLELKLQPASSQRPTLDELIEENRKEDENQSRRRS